MHRRLFIAPVLALIVVAAAGCGSSDSGSSTTTAAPQPAASTTAAAADTGSTSGAAAIGTAKGDLGEILVEGQGRTVYLWEKDTGPTSECSGACAQAWPPVVTTGAPTATGSAMASELGTTKRADGTMQVTYSGHPLYTFVGDKSAGQTAGQGSDGFGAEWYVLAPSGKKIDDAGDDDSGKSDDAGDDSSGGGAGGY